MQFNNIVAATYCSKWNHARLKSDSIRPCRTTATFPIKRPPDYLEIFITIVGGKKSCSCIEDERQCSRKCIQCGLVTSNTEARCPVSYANTNFTTYGSSANRRHTLFPCTRHSSCVCANSDALPRRLRQLRCTEHKMRMKQALRKKLQTTFSLTFQVRFAA